jgi:hypothetical protein
VREKRQHHVTCLLFEKNGVKEKREWVEQASDFSEVEME